MTLSESFQRYWPLSLAVLILAAGVALLIQVRAGSGYVASGSVMIAPPQVDPSRSASRAVNLAVAIAETSTAEVREAVAADGGRNDYRIIQVSENRLQVLASGERAVQGVRTVLRSLSDVVVAQQVAAGIDVDERIRPRLFFEIPEDELASLAALEGQVTGDPPEVIGTFVLEDPLADADNPLYAVALATRLVLLTITSDAGSKAVASTLPEDVDFTINAYDRRAPGLLTITAAGPEPAAVVRAFDEVTASVDAELQRRQELADIPREARLLVDVIASPLEAREANPGLSLGALGLLALGIGIALALPGILRETIGSRRGAPSTTAGSSEAPAHQERTLLTDDAGKGRALKTR